MRGGRVDGERARRKLGAWVGFKQQRDSTTTALSRSKKLLDLAIQLTEGLADIHSIDGSTHTSLVHNDINLANLVFRDNNRPMWNDFNVANLLMKHNETGQTCPLVSRLVYPLEITIVPRLDEWGLPKLGSPLSKNRKSSVQN